MKSKLILPLLTLGCSIFLVSGVLVEETNAVLAANNVPQFENDKITLDIYAEYDFNLLNYDENASYEWSSSNTSLATIKDGHLSCELFPLYSESASRFCGTAV
jgi:hypothetical protein